MDEILDGETAWGYSCNASCYCNGGFYTNYVQWKHLVYLHFTYKHVEKKAAAMQTEVALRKYIYYMYIYRYT